MDCHHPSCSEVGNKSVVCVRPSGHPSVVRPTVCRACLRCVMLGMLPAGRKRWESLQGRALEDAGRRRVGPIFVRPTIRPSICPSTCASVSSCPIFVRTSVRAFSRHHGYPWLRPRSSPNGACGEWRTRAVRAPPGSRVPQTHAAPEKRFSCYTHKPRGGRQGRCHLSLALKIGEWLGTERVLRSVAEC